MKSSWFRTCYRAGRASSLPRLVTVEHFEQRNNGLGVEAGTASNPHALLVACVPRSEALDYELEVEGLCDSARTDGLVH